MQIGLIGADSDARLRADCYDRLPDVDVSGVVGDCDGPLDWTASRAYPDVETLLVDGVVDAVDIRDPTRPQSEIVDRCLDAGVAVVCHAPLAHDVDDAASIRRTAEGSDRPVLVDAHHRFARENSEAKSLLDADDIGTPTTVRTTRRIPVRHPDRSQTNAERDRLLVRALYPDVASVRWLLGDIERVFTRLQSGRDSDGADSEHHHALVIARLASGAVGHLEVSYGDRHDLVTVEAEYSGTEGRLTYDSETSRPLGIRSRESIDTGVHASFERPRPSSESHVRHVEHLVACLRNEAEPVESLSTAIETLRTVRAAIESARRGVPVDVKEVSA